MVFRRTISDEATPGDALGARQSLSYNHMSSAALTCKHFHGTATVGIVLCQACGFVRMDTGKRARKYLLFT